VHTVNAVVGEALIDLVDSGTDGPWLAHPGGSPLNVAVGLARLGQPTAYVGRLSTDPFGTLLRTHAQRSGVDLTATRTVPQPSSAALVTVDADGGARYEFSVVATADFGWTPAEPPVLPEGTRIVHFGSLASWLPPGAAALGQWVAALYAAGDVLISYDPNVRPPLQPDAAAAREAVERSLQHAHLAKASDADLRYLYGSEDVHRVCRRWLDLGPDLVVITRGADGATAFPASGGPVHRPVPQIQVVDTVGAGDSFTSGLLDALQRRGVERPGSLASLSAPALAAVLDEAARVAALTCTRAGADPPWRHELDAFERSR
jgi:fructokinase